jgi:hypothetical protein
MGAIVPIKNKKAYEYLYILENEFRKLIIKFLTIKSKGSNWTTLIQKNIIDKWNTKKNKEEESYQIIRSSRIIDYSDFDDIGNIIQKHWDIFSDVFSNQLTIISKLYELEFIRNAVAHNRELSSEEFKRLKIYFSDIKKIISKNRSIRNS